MKDRSVAMTPRQRSAFILMGGRRTLSEVLAATAPTGVTPDDIQQLVDLGLLTDAAPAKTAAEAAAQEAKAEGVKQHKERSPQQRYQDAYPIAARLAANLGLRGFWLNLAVEAAGNYEQLAQLAPKIQEAVGPEKFAPLEEALNDR